METISYEYDEYLMTPYLRRHCKYIASHCKTYGCESVTYFIGGYCPSCFGMRLVVKERGVQKSIVIPLVPGR